MLVRLLNGRAGTVAAPVISEVAIKTEDGHLLCRFQLSNFVRHRMSPLYEWIVETAHHEGLRGATVLKGFFGLRPEGCILREHRWSISQELPVIVEVFDQPTRIAALLAKVEPAFHEGMITLQRAQMLLDRASSREARGPCGSRNNIASDATTGVAGVLTMAVPETGVLLRIFINESDTTPDRERPLYEAIVRKAREANLAGATVLRGPMGFGRHSRVHTVKLLELSTDLPVVIEIVDAEDKMEAFLPTIDELVTDGLVTLEAVRLLRYAARGGRPR